jgi:lipopolysaccharide export system protein LptA
MYPIKISIFFICLFLGSSVFALSKDRGEKIFIVADSSTLNYKTGINMFEGHVKADQGSTHIIADKMITKSNVKHEIQEVIAFGITRLAEYSTLPSLDKLIIKASSKIIKYYPIESNVVFENEVHIVQGENDFKGQKILYNMNEEIITVPASVQSRAILVYNPNKQ